MKKPITVSEIKDYLAKAEFTFRHQECATCECYLGYVAQLEIDADQDGRSYLKEYKLANDQIHSCLGCDPCPPGTLHANYLRKRTSRLE